jgi:3,4-dihydroxy 2-butanone 4-phosphate synthase
MTRGAQIDAFVKERNIPVLTIAELADFRMALAAARELAEETV